MALPIANTTISIYRAPQQTDAWPDTEPQLRRVSKAIRATFGQPLRAIGVNDPTIEILRVHFYCDATDADGNEVVIQHNDVLKDEAVGTVWRVMWVDDRPGIAGFAGLGYIRGIAKHDELPVSAGAPVLVD